MKGMAIHGRLHACSEPLQLPVGISLIARHDMTMAGHMICICIALFRRKRVPRITMWHAF